MSIDRQLFVDKLKRFMSQLQVDIYDLSEGTGIHEDRLQELMFLQDDPSGDEVLIFSDYFKCDYHFFISNQKYAIFERTENFYRVYGDELSSQDRFAIQEFIYLCECEDLLMKEIGLYNKSDEFFFVKKGWDKRKQGHEAAAELRRHLDIGTHDIPDVFNIFRKLNLHIFRRKLAKSSISGLHIRHPEIGKCILVNYDEDLYRQRFTVAHEVGHSILDDNQDDSIQYEKYSKEDLSETRANNFASHLLLPPQMLRGLPNPMAWSREIFIDYANRLQVNAQTLAIGLYEVNKIDELTKQEFSYYRLPREIKQDQELKRLSTAGKKRMEGLLQRGLSDGYVELCFQAYDDRKISLGKLTEMLLSNSVEIASIFKLYNRAMGHGD